MAFDDEIGRAAAAQLQIASALYTSKCRAKLWQTLIRDC